MKTFFIFGLLLISLPAMAWDITFEPEEITIFKVSNNDGPSNKLLKSYCVNAEGSVNKEPTKLSFDADITCTKGHTAQYFYEGWAKYGQDIMTINPVNLVPRITDQGFGSMFANLAIKQILKDKPEYQDCPIIEKKNADGKIQNYFKCTHGEVSVHSLTVPYFKDEKFFRQAMKDIFELGKLQSEANNPEFHKLNNQQAGKEIPLQKEMGRDDRGAAGDEEISLDKGQKKNVAVSMVRKMAMTVTKISDFNKTLTNTEPDKEVVVNPTTQKEDVISPSAVEIKKIDLPVGEEVKKNIPEQISTNEAPVKESDDKDCAEALKKELSQLLSDDKKNVLGLQYELTVIKMAAIAVGNKSKTLEGLVKKKSQELQRLDEGVIKKMKDTYKKYGLPDDVDKIAKHLKDKSKTADYGPKDKRFFNQESSAFLLAYQKIHDNSGIKDSDVSVLWFFDKVSQKTKQVSGNYSSAHNRSNLSTRIAQYTGLTGARALNHEELEGMSKKLKAKIDKELLDLIAHFKETNQACYNNIFGQGDDECNLNIIDNRLSEILAVNSQISSLDLVNVDGHLKGDINKVRFSLNRFIDVN